jgi:T3SS negative regulator,GrlR
MEDGLYRVEFRTSDDNWGAGVIHIQAGRLWGGDSAMYYLGTLRQVGGTLAVTIKTDRHTQTLPQPILSVFGKNQVTINVSGKDQGSTLKLTGSVADTSTAVTVTIAQLSD